MEYFTLQLPIKQQKKHFVEVLNFYMDFQLVN